MSIAKRLAALAAALCLAVGLAGPAGADVVQPTDEFYVADYANVLQSATEQAIVEKNDYLYAQSGAQIVVVTVQDTGGLTLEEYGYRLANDWGIGSSKEDNGVLLLLSIGGQDYQCMQGSGLEDQLPTMTLSRILQDDLEPDFAAGDYDAGVEKTFDSLYRQVCGIYGLSPTAYADYDYGSAGTQASSGGGVGAGTVIARIVGGILLLVLVILLISALSGSRRRRSYRSGNSGFFTGMAVGSALNSRRRRRPPPPPRPPRPPRSSGSFFRSGGGGGFRSGGSGRSGGFRSGGGFRGPRGGGGGGFRGGGAGRGH